MRYLFAAFILSNSAPLASAQLKGKQLCTMHCATCHHSDVSVAGMPTQIEIASLYRGKEADFIKWAHNPTPHKRKHLQPMTVMTHVPKADLKKIYSYIMETTKGKKEQASQKGDQFPHKLSRRPLVQRIFLEKAGPAAIAVALDHRYAYCFDAGATRLRYIWTDGFLDGYPYWEGNGNALAKLQGKILLNETRSPLPFVKEDPKFLGYSMKDGLPTFNYRAGSITVDERIIPTPAGLRRTFTIQGAPSQLTLTFPKVAKLTYSSERGEWNDTKLTTTTEAPIVINYNFAK